MGMGGVQRTSKFVKYLRDFDWEPFVLTTNTESYYAEDITLLKELSEKNINVFRTQANIKSNIINSTSSKKIAGNEKKRKFLSKISKIILIPDAAILWYGKAINLAGEIIKKEKIDLIYATAPPYTSLLIGKKLSKKYSLPFIADYRDAWFDCPYNFYPTPLHKILHKSLEKSVLKKVDKIITINNSIKNLIEFRYSNYVKDNVKIISQGFDKMDYNENTSDTEIDDEKFTVTYSGSFFNLMTPEYFLKALKLVFDWFPNLQDRIQAVFIGVFPEKYKILIEDLEINKNVKILGYKNHIECIDYIKKSDLLWMMIGRSKWSYMISTGKIFEYMGSKKPILACIPDGEAKNSLKNYGNVFFAEPDNPEDIAEKIVDVINKRNTKMFPEVNEKFVDSIERKYLTGILVKEFNDLQ